MAAVADRVAAALGVAVADVTALDGGMIGQVHRVDLADGRTVVAKTGDTPLSVEAYMLRYLADRSPLPVPAVEHATDDLLVLEHVEGDSKFGPAVARDAADHLAALHDVTADAFGFPRDTLTGPVRQPNPWTDSWVAFYREHRVRHVAGLAREEGALPPAIHERVESFAADLDAIVEEPAAPALVHGDAWTTNVLARDGRVTAFLDPACYYAHPEIELAYVDWTGTFGDAFFDRYRERHPIVPGFHDGRRDAYAVYPLLVHVHLFGGDYPDELAAALARLGY